jgi:hypothetical protein
MTSLEWPWLWREKGKNIYAMGEQKLWCEKWTIQNSNDMNPVPFSFAALSARE